METVRRLAWGTIHVVRRRTNMLYLVDNNGTYGLTKGQFSATNDKGSTSKKGPTLRTHRSGEHGPNWVPVLSLAVFPATRTTRATIGGRQREEMMTLFRPVRLQQSQRFYQEF